MRRLDYNEGSYCKSQTSMEALQRIRKDYFHHYIMRLSDLFQVESNIYVVTEYLEVCAAVLKQRSISIFRSFLRKKCRL